MKNLLMKTIEKAKRYKFLYLCIRFILIIYCNYIIYYKHELLYHLRDFGVVRSRKFSEIRKYKNKHAGKRCFIVCTGPSLTYEDLELLKGEITFSMNTIIKCFHRTDWRPTYYGIQDIVAYKECQEFLLSDHTLTPFIPDCILNMGYKIPSNTVVFPFSFHKHRIWVSEVKKLSTKFSGNAAALVYAGYTVTYSLLQVAVYMGFKDIYLLGCDCYYPPEQENQHFVETKTVDPIFATAASRMIFAYQVAKRYADRHCIHIYNATRGGQLEVFERVSLEEVLL
jgi:hypothetical protein